MDISYQTNGKYAWQQYYKFPVLGVRMAYQSVGRGPYFGDGFYFAPYIERYIKQRKRYKTYLQTIIGVSYLTKKYDYYTNPLQNAIGSHWNTSISFIYGYRWTLNHNWSLNTGRDLFTSLMVAQLPII